MQAPETTENTTQNNTLQIARSERTKGYVLLAITLLIWGSFTLISRVGTTSALTPWDIAGLRFATAAMVLIPIQCFRREWRFLFNPHIIAFALIGGMLYSCLAYLGFGDVPAAHAAIWLNGMLPLWTALSAWVMLGETFTRDTWLSLCLIGLGIGAMVGMMAMQDSFHLGIGDLYFFLAAGCWGVYSALLKRWPVPPWQAMAGVALWSAVIYLPVYWFLLPRHLEQASFNQIALQGIFQGIFVVIIAMLTYIGAIKRLGAFRSGSLLALAPLLAAVAAVPLLHEPLTMALLMGILGVSLGALQPWRWGRKISSKTL